MFIRLGGQAQSFVGKKLLWMLICKNVEMLLVLLELESLNLYLLNKITKSSDT